VEALHSALAQTDPPLEIIVCDDGSTDGTADAVRSLDGPIRLISQANAGEAAAKNAAVRESRGEFVVVLDADDVWLPRRLESLCWLASRRPDLDVLVTDAFVEVAGATVRRAYHPGWPFPVEDQRRAIVERNFVLGMAAVRRSRWLEYGGFDETLTHTADWEFWQRLVLAGSIVGLVDEPLARYRLSRHGVSSDREVLVRNRVVVLKRVLARPDLSATERAAGEAALARQRRDLLLRRARSSLLKGDPEARRRCMAVARAAGLPVRTRVAALFAAMAPILGGRLLSRRDDGGTEVGGGLRLPSENP
jgi:glycosyltransferase involved in cell wall biosynthesis